MQSIRFKLSLLGKEEIERIHQISIRILSEIGVRVNNEKILSILSSQSGADIDLNRKVVRFSEELVMVSIEKASKQFSLYGRDEQRKAGFGYGEILNLSMPGTITWFEEKSKTRRNATVRDAQDAIALGDELPNIDIVGAMAEPVEVPREVIDIHLYSELVRGTTKPVAAWIQNRKTVSYIMEILQAVAGGENKLRKKPLTFYGMQPMSPLQFDSTTLEILTIFAEKGLPVAIGPQAQSLATAPGTLAGTVAQENAEILAGVVIAQTLSPGLPILYAGAPHIMDPKVANISFGSPEQGIMGVAMNDIGKNYGFPVALNVGGSDSKAQDAQLGLEKGANLLLGALAGADIFNCMGLIGGDKACSLAQLVIDDEIISFVKRIVKAFEVNEESLAFEVIKGVGIGGNFLAAEHTVKHFRKELWFPRLLDRESWEIWEKNGAKHILDRAMDEQKRILSKHRVEPLEEHLEREIKNIVAKAEQNVLGVEMN